MPCFIYTVMGRSTRCYVSSSIEIRPPVAEKNILTDFFIHGGHLGHVTWIIHTKFGSTFLRRTHIKFDFDWSCEFRSRQRLCVRCVQIFHQNFPSKVTFILCTNSNLKFLLSSLYDYSSVSWGATSSANIERLNTLQKRAARIILHADFTTVWIAGMAISIR